ncbi:MAG: hypothetical protein Q7R93_03465 [bacterium]|nr:hypothetical protein [bacterium]
MKTKIQATSVSVSSELLKWVQAAELKALGPLFHMLAQKVFMHRKANGGLVPPEIFPSCVGIGGVYPCVEVAIRVLGHGNNTVGYVLKKRGNAEQGWNGLYGIPGVSGLTIDSPSKMFSRLGTKIWGEKTDLFRRLAFVGVEMHDEPERDGVTCWTMMYCMNIALSEQKELSGQWKLFLGVHLDDPSIVPHHRKTLAWIDNPDRPLLANLRS